MKRQIRDGMMGARPNMQAYLPGPRLFQNPSSVNLRPEPPTYRLLTAYYYSAFRSVLASDDSAFYPVANLSLS